MASRSLSDLRPQFAEPVIKWLGECGRVGLDILVTNTFRSIPEQNELFKVGRSVKNPEGVTAKRPMGRTKTNARGGESAHNYGLALDFVPMIQGKPDWSGKHPAWAQAIAIAEKYGLQSLAKDPKFSELAHLQLKNWRSYIGAT